MATLTKPFTFTGGTYAVAAQVNSDMDTLYNWVNTNAMWTDASRAFTAIPSGPNADPSSANQLTRKSYVDGHLATKQVRVGFGSGTTVSGGGLRITYSSPFTTATDGVVCTSNVGAVAQVDSSDASSFHTISWSINGGTLLVGVSVGYYYIAWGH